MTENYNPAQQREYLTTMRRASLGFVPILVEELTSSIEQAAISDGNLVESAELKAMRESLLVARMSNGLQLPKEHVWLDNLIRSFIEAIKLQWHEGMDEQIARARSNWLLAQIDIRNWSHRYKIDKHPEIGELQYREQLISLAMLSPEIQKDVKDKYWHWLDDALLKQVKEEQRDLFNSVVRYVMGIVGNAYERSQQGDDCAS